MAKKTRKWATKVRTKEWKKSLVLYSYMFSYQDSDLLPKSYIFQLKSNPFGCRFGVQLTGFWGQSNTFFMLLYIYLCSTDTSYQRCTPVLGMCQCPCGYIELYHLLKILSVLTCHVSVCLCRCFIEIFTFTCFQFRNNFPKMFSHCSFDIT
jgi:hypothetical protein